MSIIKESCIFPIVLSGGSGTRLWPLSRASYPKQLIPLFSENSLLQDTILRMIGKEFAGPLIICNEAQRFVVAEQMRAAGIDPYRIMVEPIGRNTAPAITMAALYLAKENPDSLMLVLPSDHIIKNEKKFKEILISSVELALNEFLVLFGIVPDRPETGYGYIKAGNYIHIGSNRCGQQVEAFFEKPDKTRAQFYFEQDGYYWNSGIFLFTANAYLQELSKINPEMLNNCKLALENGREERDFVWIDKLIFQTLPNISIDYQIMEKTDKAVVVPADIGWSDLGAWSALWAESDKNECSNVLIGDVVSLNVNNSYLRSEGPLTAVVGVENIVVVATDDAILVVDKNKTDQIKDLIEILKLQDRKEASESLTIHRPWGSYRTIESGHSFNIKQLTIHPGAKISLQKHLHRSEHWIIMQGTAKIIRDNEEFLLYEKQSTYIPMGVVHRLENPGHISLQLIEVQLGSYFGEDDIIRLEDQYGRIKLEIE